MGYATYVFSDEKAEAETLYVDESANIMENDSFRITVDPEKGSILSIYDKKNQKELVDPGSEFGFSQYLNERFSYSDVISYNQSYNRLHGGRAVENRYDGMKLKIRSIVFIVWAV